MQSPVDCRSIRRQGSGFRPSGTQTISIYSEIDTLFAQNKHRTLFLHLNYTGMGLKVENFSGNNPFADAAYVKGPVKLVLEGTVLTQEVCDRSSEPRFWTIIRRWEVWHRIAGQPKDDFLPLGTASS